MDLNAEHSLTLANDFIHATITLPGMEKATATERLEAIAPGNGEALLHLLAGAVAVGYSAGQATQAPADDRLTLLVRALRGVHTREMFDDCTEDGDPFPCRTIRALNIVAGHADAGGPDEIEL